MSSRWTAAGWPRDASAHLPVTHSPTLVQPPLASGEAPTHARNGSDGQPITDISAATQLRLAVAIIALATLHALLWSLVREPGTGGPDEAGYFRVVDSIAANGSLPVFEGYAPQHFAGGPVRAQVAREITPNFTAVPIAMVIAAIASSDYDLNIHIARLFMVAVYPITLSLSFLTLRRLFGSIRTAPVIGVTIMAAIPMFTLVHTYYTNDAPAIAASTCSLYALVRASQSGFCRKDSLILGATLGLVALHKYTGFLMFPATAFVVLWHFVTQPRRVLEIGITLLLSSATLAAWWYIRNTIVYGDPVGVGVTQSAINVSGGAPEAPRTRGLNLLEFIQETNWLGENFATFWAGYGLEKLKLPGAAYIVVSTLSVVAITGLFVRARRAARARELRPRSPILITCAGLHVGLWIVSFWSSYSVDVALSGRYVFPTLLPAVILLVHGLAAYATWRGQSAAIVLLTVPVMLAANGAYFFHVVLPDVTSLRPA